ncbi:hypothetical protein DAKH74_036450 [Maudiozyma humilis]|uniref:Uncharacterized protein n=1 Tax=Maudiozyma humilis TaxID=51915 RepID=A0AAV5RZG9_MAUHU|nr:hypothetical protein DAKH74_036450 [Kazachstania humilis]
MLPHIAHTILLTVITLCSVRSVSAIGGADSEGYPYVSIDATGAGFNVMGSDKALDVTPELYSNITNLPLSVMFLAEAALSLSTVNTTVPSFSFPINENHTSQKEAVFGFDFDVSHVEVEGGALMTPTETGTYTFQLDYTGLSAAIIILKEAYYCGGVSEDTLPDILDKSIAADVSSGPDYTSHITKTVVMEAGQTYFIGFVYFSVFNETYHNTQQYASMDFSVILPSGETITDFSDYAKNQYDKSASATCLYYDTTSITATGTDTYIVTGIETVTLTPTGTALGTAAVPIVEELHYVILPSGYTMTDSPSSSSYESSSTQVSSSIDSSSTPPSSSSSIELSSSEISSSALPSSTAQPSSSYSSSVDSVLSASSSTSLSEYTSSSTVFSFTSSSETPVPSQSSPASSEVLSFVSSVEPTGISSMSEFSSNASDTIYTSKSSLDTSAQESLTSSRTSISQSFSSVPNRNVVSSNVSESSRVQSSSFTITGSTQSSEIVSRSNGIISSSIGEVSVSLSKSSTGPFDSSPVTSATARYSNPSGVDDEPRSITSSLSIQSIVQPFSNTTSPSNQVAPQSLTTKTITNTQGVVITTVVSCESSSNANLVATTDVIESRKVVPTAISVNEEYSSKLVTTQVFNGAGNNVAGNGPSQVVQSNAASHYAATVVVQHSTVSTNVAHSKEGTSMAQFGAATTVLSVTGKASPTAILYSPESGNAAQHNSVGFVITLLSLLSFSAWF